MPISPYLSLTLINQQAAPCDLFFGGLSPYWAYNGQAPPTRIDTNETLSGITNQAVSLAEPVVLASLVIMQEGYSGWELDFRCPSVGTNNVTSIQRGYGAISVRLAPPWNTSLIPLLVTATIIQTGMPAPTADVEPADWAELPELPLRQILYRRFRRGRRKTSSIVRIGPAAPEPAQPGGPAAK